MSVPQVIAVREAAWAAHRAGLCVVPPREDGSKAPLGEWKEYQAARPTEDELQQWYAEGRQGVGLITGKVSGNLELLEFDAANEAYGPFVELARAAGLGSVVGRIEAGYLERSPAGGTHWLYRCSTIEGNTKLAQRLKRPEEKKDPKDTVQVLIETRGEGGFVVTAPSYGTVHETGRPYELLRGSFETIATITPEERTALWELAGSFDQMPTKERPQERERRQEQTRAGGRPGDDFNARTTWAAILGPHGWVSVYTRGEVTYWRRPGKERGLSATTGFGGDWLYCFSTSTEFEAKQAYNKFATYALLNHGGDYAAAARDLAAQGYGQPSRNGSKTEGQEAGVGQEAGERQQRRGRPREFVASAEAKALRESGWFFAKGGGQLNVYRDGVYRPGESILRAHLTERLGDRWGAERVSSLVQFLIDSSPELWERPPIDRLNVRNGILNLDTGGLVPHSPAFLSPIQINASFDPDADCPRIRQFVDEVFPPDGRPLAYEIPGLLLVPDTTFQKAIMTIGPGANGKGTYNSMVTRLLGEENVAHIPLQALATNRFMPAELYGRLANIFSDLSPQRLEDVALFKSIVGEDQITTERKYGAPFSFRPYARLLFSANEVPASPDVTYAYLRRWIAVPFLNRFEGDRVERNLVDKLTTPSELSGLLSLALAAYERMKERGSFTSGASTMQAARDFLEAIDSVPVFLQDAAILAPHAQVDKAALHKAFTTWVETQGRGRLSAIKFNRRLIQHVPGVAEKTIKGRPYWQGVGLKARDGEGAPG